MTKLAKIKRSRTLKLGWPDPISLNGAEVMEQVVGYLYRLRGLSRNQIERLVAPEHVKSVRHWLSEYPYITRRNPKGVVTYYDVAAGEWRSSRNFGVYTLTNDVVHVYEEEAGLEAGYVKYPDSDFEPQNLRNTMLMAEIYLQLRDGGRSDVQWLNNQMLANRIVESRGGIPPILTMTGGVEIYGVDKPWGFLGYLKSHAGIVRNANMAYPAEEFQRHVNFAIWVRNASEEAAIVALYGAQKKYELAHMRVLPYEWYLHHPGWLYETLKGNPWAALGPYLDMKRRMGSRVEQLRELGQQAAAVEPYMWRIVDPGGSVEYVDVLTGIPLNGGVELISQRKGQEKARRVLFAGTIGELKAWAEIMRLKAEVGVELRLIDWPGGK